MRLAFVGLGKLGLPTAEVLATAHEVSGYDIAPRSSSTVHIAATLAEALHDAEAVMVCIQTPHAPAYEGITPAPDDPADFDYSYLRAALVDITTLAPPTLPVIIISTVLPGTSVRLLEPLVNGPYIYEPLFAAMGTVTEDLRHPEFTIAGVRYTADAEIISRIWKPINDAPIIPVTVESAELAKVAYNCWVSAKVVLANSIGEIATAVGADPCEVDDVLTKAIDRIASPAYMRHGMADGGECHPRDVIAMSYLSQNIGLTHDPFSYVVRAREAHMQRLAIRVARLAAIHDLPIIIVGRSYKPGVDIDTGSSSLLLAHYLLETGHEPRWLLTADTPGTDPAIYVLAHPVTWPIPEGSVVVDPWR